MSDIRESCWEIICQENCPWCKKTLDFFLANFIPFNAIYIEDNPHLESEMDIEIYPTIYRDGVKIGSYTRLLIHLNEEVNK